MAPASDPSHIAPADEGMARWEYLIVGLPKFPAPAEHKGESDAVAALNREGELGWEAVALVPLDGGGMGVLFKRSLSELSNLAR